MLAQKHFSSVLNALNWPAVRLVPVLPEAIDLILEVDNGGFEVGHFAAALQHLTLQLLSFEMGQGLAEQSVGAVIQLIFMECLEHWQREVLEVFQI